VLRCLLGLAPVDDDTSAYCQARAALPQERLEQIVAATAHKARQRLPHATGRLNGRPVKVVDGSSTQLPDTAANQKEYPQPTNQRRGCGFPVMKLAVLFCLASGAVLAAAFGNLHGHDLRIWQPLWEGLLQGDILLGDRAYGEFTTLAALPKRGVDVIARLHQRRKADYRKAKRLGKQDGLFVWQRPRQPSDLLSAAEWALLPEHITVRVICFVAQTRGFRAQRLRVVTTLLDPQTYRAEAIIATYLRRWRLELCLRDLKTTLGMERLSCQSPALARKEVLAYLIAHNLIRCVMAAAVRAHDVDLERVSFKGTVDAVRVYCVAIARANNPRQRQALWNDLLRGLAEDAVPCRPGREEPRATKRRPKPYPYLTKPRRQYREIPHRNRYCKSKRAQRNSR